MTRLTADRRLYVTAEKDRIVEEGDPDAAWLLYAAGRVIGLGDVERFGMEEDKSGRVIYEGAPRLSRPKLELVGQEAAEGSEETEGPDDSDRNNEGVLVWPGRTSPEAYLKRYPTGPKAELARAVIAARDDGADGES